VLFHFARHQCLAEHRCCVAIERQQQAAAGGAVEAMDEEDLPAELLAQPVRGKVAFPTRQLAVVDHQPRGLVDDGEEFVAVEDRKRLPLRRDDRLGRQRRGHAAATAQRPPMPAIQAAAGIDSRRGPPASRPYRIAATTSRPLPKIAATVRRCTLLIVCTSSDRSRERRASSCLPCTCWVNQACTSRGTSGAWVIISGRRLRNSPA